MKLRCFVCLIALSAGILSATASADEPVMSSPEDVWRGYDPTTVPLEVESLKTWEEQGARFEKLRFTSEEVDGVKVRVFAIQGAPLEGSSLPGILHIHGGGQTASLDWLKFWTKRGYVAATFDFCGPWADRTEVTDWGPLKHCNMAESQGGMQVDPTPRASSWYHWTVASRRALTLLADHPQVDRAKLGIFGISMGGTLCWMVAGSDPRVKTAVPIYGCGYNHDSAKTRWGFPVLTPQLALFQRTMSSEAHAPFVRCPVLFLNATNDFHGWMDSAFDTLKAMPGPHWQSFTPRYNHHIAPPQGAALPAWMDHWFKDRRTIPDSPTLSTELSVDGQLVTHVRANDPQVDHVDVLYSLGDKPPPNRFWRRRPAERVDSSWWAVLPVVDVWQDVFVFANVHYKSGIALSTNLGNTRPAQLGKARATLDPCLLPDPNTIAEGWFYATAYTDPLISKRFLTIDPSDRGPVISLVSETFGDPMHVNIANHVLGDPQFTGADRASLAFDVAGAFNDDGLNVTIHEREWTPQGKKYTAKIESSDLNGDWTNVALPLSRFQSAEGHSPTSWRVIEKLQLEGKAAKKRPFRVANLRWLPRFSSAP